MSLYVVFLSNLSFAFANYFQTVDFPEAGGPRINTQCLISNNSYNYTTFKILYGLFKKVMHHK